MAFSVNQSNRKGVIDFGLSRIKVEDLQRVSDLMDSQNIPSTNRFVRYVENGHTVEMGLDQMIEQLNTGRGD